jgi:hypothetical protein
LLLLTLSMCCVLQVPLTCLSLSPTNMGRMTRMLLAGTALLALGLCAHAQVPPAAMTPLTNKNMER